MRPDRRRVPRPLYAAPVSLPRSLPTSRVPDPADAPPLRWGILAPGGIARSFADGLHRHTRQRVVAAGSRSLHRARVFADKFGVERAYGSYQELVDDPAVDVVYVASPHSGHHEQALLAIAAGKHVLVEKAFTRNATEAADVVRAARAAGVFAMEAMWTRFLPRTDVLTQLLTDGVLGELRSVLADNGQWFEPDPGHRLFDPEQAGGTLLDLGIYPISFAWSVLGRPDSFLASGTLTDTAVDAQVAMILQYPAAQAVLAATLTARTPTAASVSGTLARVEIGHPFYTPVPLVLIDRDGERITGDPEPIAGHLGLCHEAAHVAQLIADGATESPLMPLDESVAIMTFIDEVRARLGVGYPGE
ncbi:Gfo/Idh/MocA family oxidoreductase [Nakamurella flavida]